MADKFLQHEGVETGYFAKRKKQFNEEIAKGISSTGVKAKVQAKKKQPTTNSKRDIENQPPAKDKNKDENEKDTV